MFDFLWRFISKTGNYWLFFLDGKQRTTYAEKLFEFFIAQASFERGFLDHAKSFNGGCPIMLKFGSNLNLDLHPLQFFVLRRVVFENLMNATISVVLRIRNVVLRRKYRTVLVATFDKRFVNPSNIVDRVYDSTDASDVLHSVKLHVGKAL